jgi:hypothetical protein
VSKCHGRIRIRMGEAISHRIFRWNIYLFLNFLNETWNFLEMLKKKNL